MKRNTPEYRAEQYALWCKIHAALVEHYLRIGKMKKAEQFAKRVYHELNELDKLPTYWDDYTAVIAIIRKHGAANFIKHHFDT